MSARHEATARERPFVRALVFAGDIDRRRTIIGRLEAAGFETRSVSCAEGASAAIAEGWADVVMIDRDDARIDRTVAVCLATDSLPIIVLPRGPLNEERLFWGMIAAAGSALAS